MSNQKTQKMNELDSRILAYLEKCQNTFVNLSEISRVVNKAPPTIKRAVVRLEKMGKVMINDKKSMKLVRLVK